jgi:hypothetical protein
MKHEFHNTIREVLSVLDVGRFRFLWDEACGGLTRLPLFREASKSRQSWYTCPDAILHDGSAVKLILEIEEAGETGFHPAHLFGKFNAAVHSRFFIAEASAALPLSSVMFIQIVNTSGLKIASRKRIQYENIEIDIRAELPRQHISSYYLMAGDSDEFSVGHRGDQLRSIVGAMMDELRSGGA